MAKERNDATGQFVEKATLDDVLAVFSAVDGPPVVTSSDVAEATGISHDSARRKLEELAERGRVDSRKSAGRVLYWRTEDAERGRETGHTPPEHSRDRSDVEPSPTTHASQESRESAGSPESLDSVEFPQGRDREECLAAVDAAREYIKANNGATMRELVTEVMPIHPVGYDVPTLEEGDRYRGAWWRKVVKPGLEAIDVVEKPPKGGSEWTYTGPDV